MYSETVMDHFTNPRNTGSLDDPDGVGEVGSPVCGDMMRITIRVVAEHIEELRFETLGCGAAIASSSMVTEMAKGMALEDAEAITKQDVADALDGLPAEKLHCSVLATDGLKEAIADYRSRSGQ